MSGSPIVLESSNLSLAWGKAFLEVITSPKDTCRPLIVSASIDDLDNNLPCEDPDIRLALDQLLKQQHCNSCSVSGMVIFPYKFWRKRKDVPVRDFCKSCVEELYPRMVKANKLNRHGTYFTRLMSYETLRKGEIVKVNQVEEVIDRLLGLKRFRATGLQMTCFSPSIDHTPQPRLGFPCLQNIGITYEGKYDIAITGFYPSQHIFDRAYGNYLGLSHLGSFICHHTGLNLTRVTCIAMRPMLGSNRAKKPLSALRSLLETKLAGV